MEMLNEPGPAQGDAKIEQQVHDNFDKSYEELLKNDQQQMEAKIRGETAVEFDKVRKLGFVTLKDIEENQKQYYSKYVEETKALRAEVTALREWVMRAKAQGLNSGATEGNIPPPPTSMQKWKPSW